MRDENLIYDQSAEQGVLAILLNSENAVNRLKYLKASLFADKRNKAILKLLIKLHRKGMPISAKSLSDYLLRSKERVEEISGLDYLIEVSKNYISDLNFDYWLGILNEQSHRRDLVNLANKAQELAENPEMEIKAITDEFAFAARNILKHAGPQQERFKFHTPSDCR